MRRVTWMTLGIAVGASGTVWVRRRVDEASRKMQPAQLAAAAATVATARARIAGERLRAAVLATPQQRRRREGTYRPHLIQGEGSYQRSPGRTPAR